MKVARQHWIVRETRLMNNRYVLDDRGILLLCPQCDTRNRLAYEKLGQTFRCGKCHLELPPPNEPVAVNSEAAFNALVSLSPLPVLVDFWAEWCGPCKMIAPILDEIADQYKDKIRIAKLNIDDNPATPPKFNIRGIPTLILFKNGTVEAQKVGAVTKSQLAAFLDSNL